MNPLLTGMNDKQAEAVQTTEGPLLIMAGAGSGKTRVLTHRIAYLIDEKMINPWNILAITFTNKAAREMRERAMALNPATSETLIATFHSMCVRILRREADHIGYNRNFTIVDPGEQRTLMKRILKNLNLDPKKWNERAILGTISNAKNDLLDEVAYEHQAGDMYTQIVAKCYKAYQEELRRSEAMDFDDLIMMTLRLFDKNPDVLAYYQQRYQYIHVDEYQDTNHAQYQLVKLLASRFKNICVVGDADQSIYGWRGADMQNILDFEKDYPEAKVVLLEENYRSTKNQPMKLSRTTETAVLRNFGLKMMTVNKLFITVLMTSVMKLFLLLQLLITSFVKKVRTSRISLYFTVPMLSLVPLKKPCSSQIFLIPWWGGQSSTAVKKFVMLFLT